MRQHRCFLIRSISARNQRDVLAGVLNEVGWVAPVIVNRATGNVIDGHLRVALAIERGEPKIPVGYVELLEGEEKIILATLDPIGAMAGQDGAVLDELLREVSTDDEAVQALLDELCLGVEAEQTGAGKTNNIRDLKLRNGAAIIRPVLGIDDVAVVERALAKTGLPNRAEAFLTLCQAYLDA